MWDRDVHYRGEQIKKLDEIQKLPSCSEQMPKPCRKRCRHPEEGTHSPAQEAPPARGFGSFTGAQLSLPWGKKARKQDAGLTDAKMKLLEYIVRNCRDVGRIRNLQAYARLLHE